jgi:hypothetical protein
MMSWLTCRELNCGSAVPHKILFTTVGHALKSLTIFSILIGYTKPDQIKKVKRKFSESSKNHVSINCISRFCLLL